MVIFFYRMPSFLRVLLVVYRHWGRRVRQFRCCFKSLLTTENRQRRMTSIFRFIRNILLPGEEFLEYI